MEEKIKKACINQQCALRLIEIQVENSVEQCVACNGAILTRAERLIGMSMKDIPGMGVR